MPESTARTEFDGSHGGKLAAALELPVGRPRAFALFAHCFSCTKDIRAAREIARALRAEGFAVLRFDFTGLGSSEGDFSNTNFSSNVDDLMQAAAFLKREFEAPAILIGHSLGGAAAVVAGADLPDVKGVAVIAAPAEASHVLAQIGESRAEIEEKGAATVSLAGRPFTIRKQFLEDLENKRVQEAAGRLKKPLLILHSPLDQTVGIDNATQLFLAARHPKSFVSLDRADHLLSDSRDARYAASVIAAWAGRYLEAGADDHPLEMTRTDDLDGGEAEIIADERYAVTATAGGHVFTVDADKEDGGGGLGPNPTRLVEAALAACAAITMRMYAERKSWRLDGLRVTVARAAGENAHRSRKLEKIVEVQGDIDAVRREKLLEIADKCPVHRMLADGTSISSRLAK